jgi:hypothetical protein
MCEFWEGALSRFFMIPNDRRMDGVTQEVVAYARGVVPDRRLAAKLVLV